MKSISIPTHNNPFTVIINNKEYTYKGGETIEVPDEVAELLENNQGIAQTPATPRGGITLVVETNEEGTKVVTPLNAIRDAWLSGRLVVLPLTRNGYTIVYTLVTGGVRSDNGNFLSALFSRVSSSGIEFYTIEENANLVYRMVELP